MDTFVHSLKCWPEFFEAIRDGSKKFTIRKQDRPRRFQVGDEALFFCWDPEAKDWIRLPDGKIKTCVRTISCVIGGEEGPQWGLQPGYCVLGLK